MEEKNLDLDILENVNGGAGNYPISTDNRCPNCHSVAYILVLVEAGGMEHRRCTSCKTDYYVKKY